MKATYVDGFVLTVPKAKRATYRKMASDAKKVWKRFGALDYKECVIDDPKPKWIVNTFPKMAKARAGEQVWFSYIVFKDKTHRNKVNKEVMAYFDKKYTKKDMEKGMPFDMKRMAYAGFKVVVG